MKDTAEFCCLLEVDPDDFIKAGRVLTLRTSITLHCCLLWALSLMVLISLHHLTQFLAVVLSFLLFFFL